MIYSKDTKNNFKSVMVEAIRHRMAVLGKTQADLAERMGVCRGTIHLACNWDPSVSMSVFRACDIYTNAGGRVVLKFVRSGTSFTYNKEHQHEYEATLRDYILRRIQIERLSIAQAARKAQVLRGTISSIKRGDSMRADTLLDMFACMGGVIEFDMY